ncbi:LysR substrate-binding domain-containing protein [Roseobacteraceae bacterium S113]
MDLKQIRYALEVAETLNFTRASENLNISQPALTTGVKKLEHSLGGALFLREGRTTRISRFGETMLPKLRDVLLQSQEALAAASAFQKLRKTPLKLGVLLTLGPDSIGPMLTSFAVQNPGVEVTVEEMALDEIKTRLDKGALDAAIVSTADLMPGAYAFEPLYREDYVVALPPDHPLAAKDHIELRDLDEEDYVDRLACEMRERVNTNCVGFGIELYARFRSDREDWVAQMVRSGLGFAFLPERVARANDLPTRPLRNPAITRTVNLVTALGRGAAPGLKDLITHVKSHLRNEQMRKGLAATKKLDPAQAADTMLRHITAQTNMAPLTEQYPTLGVAEAYDIQNRVIAAQQARGHTVSGWKIGGASKVVMAQMGINRPFYGRMLAAGALADGADVAIADFDHTSPELEIAFELAQDLTGQSHTAASILPAVARAYVAWEITMPRYHDWKFTHVDAIAANAGFAGYVLGTSFDPAALGSHNVEILLDGEIVQTGSTDNALGHPLESLAMAANHLSELGHGLRKGQIYLSGSLTPKLHMQGPGALEGKVAGLGAVTMRFTRA